MYQGHKIAVIIAAAGSGSRMTGSQPKQYLPLAGIPILARTIQAFSQHPLVDEICVVARKEDCNYCLEQMVQPFALTKVSSIVAGGKERQDSVRSGLESVSADAEYVLIHDGARPLIEEETITRVIRKMVEVGAAAAGVPVKDTIKVVSEQILTMTPDRRQLYAIQTPQAFRKDLLLKATLQAEEDGYVGTDETVLLERLHIPVALVEGTYRNLKITTMEDLIMAEALLQRGPRIGSGYDVHRLVPDRDLILGGVHIPHSHGLLGHSDADVLIHAIMDALLGAAALGDIGQHFPDTDPAYKGISSLQLLEQVGDLIQKQGYRIGNIDATILAERPKVAPHRRAMTANIATALGIPENSVGLKATTTEGLGFTGREEGIAAQAVALLFG